MSKKINLTFNLKDLVAKTLPFMQKIRRYAVVIFIMCLAIIYAFLVFKINHLNRLEPTDEAITEKLSAVKRPKVSQSDIDKIQQLQDNSVEVQSLFKQARNNPFQE